MTNQEIFDQTIRHLIAQGRPALGPSDCAYRSVDGLKCAAGYWIKDEHYDPELEDKTLSNPVVYGALLDSGFPEESLPLLHTLQVLHDSSPNWDSAFSFKDVASLIARKFRLSPSILDGDWKFGDTLK